MITTIISDFSRVLLFPAEGSYEGSLNKLYREQSANQTFNFADYFRFNEELLTFFQSRRDNYLLGIFTTDTIQEAPEARQLLAPIFSHIISAKKSGISKKDASSYVYIADSLQRPVEEILYIDDNEDNILAATKAGLQTIHYKSNEQLFAEIESKCAVF